MQEQMLLRRLLEHHHRGLGIQIIRGGGGGGKSSEEILLSSDMGRAWTYWNVKGEGGGEKAFVIFLFIQRGGGWQGQPWYRCEKRFDCHHLSAYTLYTLHTARIEKCTVAFLIRPSKCPKCPSTPALGPSPSGKEKQTSCVERAAGRRGEDYI